MINESSRMLYRGSQIVWYTVWVIESLLIIRFALKVLQANPEAIFTNIVYQLSGFLQRHLWRFFKTFGSQAVSLSGQRSLLWWYTGFWG